MFRSNLPGGTITYTTRAATDVGGDAEIHYFTTTLPITALVSGTNLIAVEVHQQAANSSDLSFDLELAGTPLADPLLPKGASWKYLDNGSNQGTAWRSPSFNDSTWSTGAAELGYGDGDEATVVSYGPDPNNKYITTYFRKAFTVTNPAGYQRLWLQVLADDGAMVYVNGTEAARVNLASGAITYTTRAIAALNEPEEARFNLFYLAPSLLVTGTNVVAVEVHQVATDTNDLSFDLALLGQTGVATTINYTYDPLYRLTNANYSGAYTYTFAYAYDQVGNRTMQTATIASTQVTTYTYDAANRLIKSNNTTYPWDNNGNLLYDGAANYLYDRANRLISTTLGSTTYLYSYNGDGVRLRQVAGSTVSTYTQDVAAPLPVVVRQIKTGSATTQYVYGLGTRPLAQNATAWEYLLPDALGSVRQIADANGNVTLAKWYEPYGTVLTSTGSAGSIFGYAGEQTDNTGRIFLRARYLQPRLGIFLSRDPWSGDVLRPGSMNGWNYTSANPVNRIDPNGQRPIEPPDGSPCDEDKDCQLIRVLGVRYEPFVYNSRRIGQIVHVQWIVNNHKNCHVAQFKFNQFRYSLDGAYASSVGLDAIWDVDQQNSQYYSFRPADAFGEPNGEVIGLIDPPGYGDDRTSVLDYKWYEAWFNFWDYLFDANKVSVADIRNAQWFAGILPMTPSPVLDSEVVWGFKFGAFPPRWSEHGLENGLEFYFQGPPGLPPIR